MQKIFLIGIAQIDGDTVQIISSKSMCKRTLVTIILGITLLVIGGCSSPIKVQLDMNSLKKTNKKNAFRAQLKYTGLPLVTSGRMDSDMYGNTFYQLNFTSSLDLTVKHAKGVFFTGHSLRGCKSKRLVTSLNILKGNNVNLYTIYFPRKERIRTGFYDLVAHDEDLCFQVVQSNMTGVVLSSNFLVVDNMLLKRTFETQQ